MNTAMILCAGYGTRLQNLTIDTPKPMLKIGEKPILEYTIRHLRSLGIINIIINLHYLPEKIIDYFGNGEKFNVNINYSYENKPLGTAGAVKKVSSILSNKEDFLLIYGDILTNENINEFYSFHKQKNGIGTIILHERIKSNSIVEMDECNKIILFLERPDNNIQKKQNWVNSGIYCFNKKILDYIPENQFYDFPKDVFPTLVKKGILYGYPLNNYRCAIDSVERYQKVNIDYENNLIDFNF